MQGKDECVVGHTKFLHIKYYMHNKILLKNFKDNYLGHCFTNE